MRHSGPHGEGKTGRGEHAEAATERKQNLRWAKIAGWSAIVGVGVGIAAIIVAIWLAK
jgi:hypothetical protein